VTRTSILTRAIDKSNKSIKWVYNFIKRLKTTGTWAIINLKRHWYKSRTVKLIRANYWKGKTKIWKEDRYFEI